MGAGAPKIQSTNVLASDALLCWWGSHPGLAPPHAPTALRLDVRFRASFGHQRVETLVSANDP
jgi:hypothetical protein